MTFTDQMKNYKHSNGNTKNKNILPSLTKRAILYFQNVCSK